jgi:chromosome segregation ATPase
MNFMMRQFTGTSRADAKKTNAGWTDEVEAMDKPAPTAARKASLTALSKHPPPSSVPPSGPVKGPSLSSSPSSNGPSLEEKAQEYERRINVLTFCLEEQVTENAQLQKRLDTLTALYAPNPKDLNGMGMFTGGSTDQPAALLERVKALESQLREKEDQIEEMQEAHAKVEEEKEELKRELIEHRKKMDALSREIDEMKKEESAATSSTSTNGEGGKSGSDKNWEDRYKREKRDKKRMEDLVFNYEETIERLKQSAKAKEKKYRSLSQRLEREKERKASLQDSTEEYEKKLQTLEKDLMDALHKEGERRMEAEYWQDSMRKKLKKLKKKLKKLETKAGTLRLPVLHQLIIL